MNDCEWFRVLLVGDDVFVRQSFKSAVQQCPQFLTCGEASDHEDAIQQLDQLHPNMIILDLSVRNGLGLCLVKRIKQTAPETRLVVVSIHDDAFYAGQVLAAGAQMCWSKRGLTTVGFAEALQGVRRGDLHVSSDIAQQLIYRAASGKHENGANGKVHGRRIPVISSLTDRELEVFEYMGQGLSTKKIAKKMRISTHTVETYRERIRHKIDAKDGADLTYRAISWVLLSS